MICNHKIPSRNPHGEKLLDEEVRNFLTLKIPRCISQEKGVPCLHMGPLRTILAVMSDYGTAKSRHSFKGELNFMAGRLLTFACLASLSWLLYIPSDISLHPDIPLLPMLRIGFAVIGIIIPLLKLLPSFRHRPLFLLFLLACYMELSAATITGITGGDPAYIGGFVFILTIIALTPFPRYWSLGLLLATVITFFWTGISCGMNFADPRSQYSLKDLASATVVSAVFIVLLHRTRHANWERAMLIEEQKIEIESEKQKVDELLLKILPQSVAAELKANKYVKPVLFNSATVIFVDIVGFSKIAEKLSPEILVNELDDLFSAFDRVMDRYNMEKLKTIGDAYMFAGGVPEPRKGHPVQAILAAMDLIDIVALRNEACILRENIRQPGEQNHFYPRWDIRIGIHTGTLMAGVVGEKKFIYDVWGDTVNLANRVESASEPNRINISQETAQIAGDFFELEARGKIAIKHKDAVNMYFVNGIKLNLSKSNNGRHANDQFWEMFQKLPAA